MTQNEVAIEAMRRLRIYAPYIRNFEQNGIVTLFEGFGGFYINEKQNSELFHKIREFEKETGCIVYAVTHEFTNFGELYDFLCVGKYDEEWDMTLDEIKNHLAFAYVWNKTDDWCSEFGTIEIRSLGGGIARVG